MIYNIIMLTVVVIGVYMQNVVQKQYTLRLGGVKNSNYVYYFMMVIVEAIAFAVMSAFFFKADAATIGRAALFALAFGTCITFQFLAIKNGSLAITALAVSFSLVIPTLYGVIFLGERLSALGYAGLGVLTISLVLVNLTGKSGDKFSFKWLICLILAFLGNGFCSTVQKIHQTAIGEVDFHEYMGFSVSFMLFAMLFLCGVFGVMSVVFRTEKGELAPLVKKGAVFASAQGLMNGTVNILMLVLASRLDAAYMYPVVTAGGIALTFVTALIFYKEKFKPWQYAGYALGVVSVILLSL